MKISYCLRHSPYHCTYDVLCNFLSQEVIVQLLASAGLPPFLLDPLAMTLLRHLPPRGKMHCYVPLCRQVQLLRLGSSHWFAPPSSPLHTLFHQPGKRLCLVACLSSALLLRQMGIDFGLTSLWWDLEAPTRGVENAGCTHSPHLSSRARIVLLHRWRRNRIGRVRVCRRQRPMVWIEESCGSREASWSMIFSALRDSLLCRGGQSRKEYCLREFSSSAGRR